MKVKNLMSRGNIINTSHVMSVRRSINFKTIPRFMNFRIIPRVWNIILPFAFLSLPLPACKRDYVPKPRGYMRIDFPEKKYQRFDSAFPYSFEFPEYGRIVPGTGRHAEPYWINIVFPYFDGQIHLSYKPVSGNLGRFTEDSRAMAYKHSIKADAIRETVYTDEDADVYAMLYEIKGDAASSLQFYATDSSSHFIRGSLYFNVQPNKDSLAPVIDFFKADIIHLIETIEWD